jgi:signal transduction histidine kinase
MLARVAAGGRAEELPAFPNGRGRTFRIKAFPLPQGAIGVAAEDISRETAARALKAAEQHVLECIASGATLQTVLTEIVHVIEQQARNTLGSILLVENGRVRHGAAPSLPSAFVKAIDGAPIGPNAGSCGTAAFRGEPVYVVDIASDELWKDYRDLALPHGLRACWSMPIFAADGRVAATFALYYREPRGPTAEELELIERAAHLVRIAIERNDLVGHLRALSAHVESVREEERTNIAREIHDQLGQTLTALKMDADWIRRRVASPPVDAGAITERLQGMTQLTDELIERVRRISAELRPGVLDDLGLLAALEWQGQEFERRSGITCTIRGPGDPLDIDRATSTAIFRIFQEALTNVLRHAQASSVEVLLDTREGRLVLQVDDDGQGIDPAALQRATSFGLLGMRERAIQLGGSAAFGRRPEGGTRVAVDVPLEPSTRRGAS